MTIILVCNKCGCQDLQMGKWGWCSCPNCGELEMFEAHPVYIIQLVRREVYNAKEEEESKEQYNIAE